MPASIGRVRRVLTRALPLKAGAHEERRQLLWGFRSWVAAGIVLVSIMSALAAWRASAFEAYSSRNDSLYRQDLARQEQLVLDNEEAVGSDVRQLSEYSEPWLLARRLRQDARKAAAGSTLRSRLLSQATRAQTAARSARGDFRVFFPDTYRSRPGYDADEAFRFSVELDPTLTELRPADHRIHAAGEHEKAHHFTGVAVLFVVGLVLLTLAEITAERRAAGEASLRGQLVLFDVRSSRPDTAHVLAGFGALTTITATGLFAIVLLSEPLL
jgi:hypothetical protein